MRKAQRQSGHKQVSLTTSVSAPVGGWNARDSIAQMKPEDAVSLDNFFCTPFDVVVRDGYSNYTTGLPAVVNSLMSYSPPSGSIKLFAASGAAFYDVSAGGAVGAAVQSGLTNSKWENINFGTAGGNFLLAVNGADKLRGYSGSAWWVDGDGTHDITGVDTATIAHIAAFKTRVWLIQKDTLAVWYLPVLSIAGAASKIDLSSLFTRGGYLMAMGDWSLDAGYGMDDYGVFVSSEGQVAIYKGTDPSSSTTWALVGVYDIGSPIGRRCMAKYSGDMTIICQDGLAPLSKALMSSRVNSQVMLTDKIQHVISDYISSYGSLFGWETTLFPKENMLLVNVPISPTQSWQVVMNTISGAWSRFTGWPAACFELHGDNLYFGGNGIVAKAWDTNADNGTNINFEALQSFNYGGNSSQLKQVKMARPIISTNGSLAILFGINTDFDETAPVGTPTFSPPSGGLWDTSLWDVGVWTGDVTIKKDWQTTFGMGYCFAAHIKGATAGIKTRWASTDYVYEPAGVVG